MKILRYFNIPLSLILLLFFSAVIRFLALDSLPPAGENALLLRFPSAFAGVVSIGLHYFWILKLSKDKQVALISGFFLSVMPWHIEQSRVHSEVMFALVALIIYGIIWKIAPCKLCKVVLTIAASIVLWRVYPSLWLFHQPFNFPTFSEYIGNLFKLISVEFLFYKNDSFWWGGLRTLGALLPSTLIFIFLGSGVLIRGFQRKYAYFPFILFFFIWILSGASPNFPESREFFLVSPLLAILAGFGIQWLWNIFQKRSFFLKIIITLYIGLVAYEYLLFYHFYTSHYPQRINAETRYEERNF